MPKKAITWVGLVIILAAGIFCSWALWQYRSEMTAAGIRPGLLAAAPFFVPILAALAIFLWYYFNERA